MKYPNNPEVIVTVEKINNDGDTVNHGDKIAGIEVRQPEGAHDAEVTIDIRNHTRSGNLVLRFPFTEFMAALSLATVNTVRD